MNRKERSKKKVIIQFNVILNDNYIGLEYTSFQMHENIWTFDTFLCPEYNDVPLRIAKCPANYK